MTYDQALALYPEGTNPRWVATHARYGRTPEVYEFSLWVNCMWFDFAQTLGYRSRQVDRCGPSDFCFLHYRTASACHEAFDAYLKGVVERHHQEISKASSPTEF